MKKIKKWLFASGLVGLLFTLSGCVQTYKSGPKLGQPTGEGWVFNLLVKPMNHIIQLFVDTFGSYGVAVIVLTIVVRAILMPLMLYQTKKSTYMSEKMQYLKPHMEGIQAKQKEATSPEEQREAAMELQRFYKENGLSMFGGMGCLPLLIQMPIFTALFFAIKYAPNIEHATFLGASLGKPNLMFTVIAGFAYLIQSYIMLYGVPEEQKKQMKTMMFMSPMMIVMMSFRAPAGVTLYWMIGGLVSIIQTVITTFYQKPRIKKQVDEEFKKNPPKVPKTVTAPNKKAASQTAAKQVINQSKNKQGKGRNAGKQQRPNKK